MWVERVHRDVAEFDDGIAVALREASRKRADAGEEFFDRKGLCHIVVRSCVEGFDLVGGARPPGYDEDGRAGPASDALDDLDSVELGHA